MIGFIWRFYFGKDPRVGEEYIDAIESANPFFKNPNRVKIIAVEKGYVKFKSQTKGYVETEFCMMFRACYKRIL